jgi:hypothetical protein
LYRYGQQSGRDDRPQKRLRNDERQIKTCASHQQEKALLGTRRWKRMILLVHCFVTLARNLPNERTGARSRAWFFCATSGAATTNSKATRGHRLMAVCWTCFEAKKAV